MSWQSAASASRLQLFQSASPIHQAFWQAGRQAPRGALHSCRFFFFPQALQMLCKCFTVNKNSSQLDQVLNAHCCSTVGISGTTVCLGRNVSCVGGGRCHLEAWFYFLVCVFRRSAGISLRIGSGSVSDRPSLCLSVSH